MGSITNAQQVDMASALKERDEKHGVNVKDKARRREGIEAPGIHESMRISEDVKKRRELTAV